jgi:hypothetical protein
MEIDFVEQEGELSQLSNSGAALRLAVCHIVRRAQGDQGQTSTSRTTQRDQPTSLGTCVHRCWALEGTHGLLR